MLFISDRLPWVVVRSEKKNYSPASGEHIGTDRKLYAEFKRGGAPAWVIEEAKKHFTFAGKSQDETHAQALAVYDSIQDQQQKGWTDEERTMIEEFLVKRNYLAIEKPKVAPPFDNYVKLTTAQGKRTIELVVEKVLEFVNDLGVKPDSIVVFERDHPRKESQAIVAAVSALSEPEEEEAEPLVAA